MAGFMFWLGLIIIVVGVVNLCTLTYSWGYQKGIGDILKKFSKFAKEVNDVSTKPGSEG